MNQWLFDTLEAFIKTLVIQRDKLLWRDPTKVVLLPNQTPMPETPNIDTLVPWTGKENCRHNLRVICDQEGLNEEQKDDYSSTMNCESSYNPRAVNHNIDPKTGKLASTDYGIVQVNDYWHIGPGKDFESPEYVLDNPEACARWAAKLWLAGNGRLWVCKSKNRNIHYSA